MKRRRSHMADGFKAEILPGFRAKTTSDNNVLKYRRDKSYDKVTLVGKKCRFPSTRFDSGTFLRRHSQQCSVRKNKTRMVCACEGRRPPATLSICPFFLRLGLIGLLLSDVAFSFMCLLPFT